LFSVEGDAGPISMPLNSDMFPVDDWKRLNGAELRKDRPIRVIFEGEKVKRVLPV